MTSLADPIRLGSITIRNRLVFGPHETNLAHRRAVSDRHVAYYRARAAGGAGMIVVEEASVHPSDWPYERAPLAEDCAEGWASVALACREEGAAVVAAIGHAGGQGSSAYHQRALWAPSSVPDVATREVPKAMEAEDLDALVAAFGRAAGAAVGASCDGVEVNAGQWSLLRQFCSGLTNQRGDWAGTDRSALLRRVLETVRAAVPGSVVGLRFSCDEMAPWAGLVPEAAVEMLAGLAGADLFDYVTVVRGSAYGTGATRPDGHVPEGFNRDSASLARGRLPETVAVVAQGSIVETSMASDLLAAGTADLVEMTRAFIADAELGIKVVSGETARVRPCTLCNQACQVRDLRNPIVSCTSDPHSGYETAESPPPAWRGSLRPGGSRPEGRHWPGRVFIVGGGPAGLECARVAALRGVPVTVFERDPRFGGMVRVASRAPGRSRLALLVDWLEAECRLAGVELVSGHEVTLEELDAHAGPVVCCTGSRPGRRGYTVSTPAAVVTAAEVLSADPLVGLTPPSPVVVWDEIGGPIGVGTAEFLVSRGASVTLVTQDFVVGEQLARTGDLAPASVRLQQAGVSMLKRSIVRSVGPEGVVVEQRDTGQSSTLPAAVLVHAGYRLPEDSLFKAATASRPAFIAGDAVAPRTILEALLEGRRIGQVLVPAVPQTSSVGRV